MGMTTPCRVILANRSRLLRGMLRRAVSRVPDLEVVGEVDTLAALPPLVEQRSAHWVIVSLWPGEDLPDALASILEEHPTLCLMGMAVDGSRARIHCAGLPERTLPGLSLDEMLEALRNHP